jgi:hypothetical protein
VREELLLIQSESNTVILFLLLPPNAPLIRQTPKSCLIRRTHNIRASIVPGRCPHLPEGRAHVDMCRAPKIYS